MSPERRAKLRRLQPSQLVEQIAASTVAAMLGELSQRLGLPMDAEAIADAERAKELGELCSEEFDRRFPVVP